MHSYDVIIVGGGFAGLSAAVALARQGARVLVVEARPGLGGRATAFTDPETGEWIDNGQHVVLGCYRETMAFLEAIGARRHVRFQAELEIPFVDRAGVPSTLRCLSLPPPWHLLAGVLEWDALDAIDRVSVLALARPLALARRHARGATSALPASPGETVENWLIRNGQSDRLREMLWEPLALAALNQSPRVAAAPTFVRVLAEMFGNDRRDAAIGLPSQPLHLMYAEPARVFIESHGGTVRTNAPARVIVEAERVVAVEVRGERLATTRVVSAVPWFALSSLFRDAPPALAELLARAAAMASSPIVTVNLWLDRAIVDVPFVGLPGRTLQWVFDKRFVGDRPASHLSLVSSGAAPVVGLANDELVGIAWHEILDAFPGARAARLLRATVVREKRATFSLAPDQPPRPGTDTPIKGLLLAGDWIDTGLPGTIESAVASGHRAAAAAAKP